MTIPKDINMPVSSLRKYLRSEYGDRLRGIYLFGSHGRGQAAEDSDIDIAVVLDEVESRFQERQRCSKAVSDISLEYNVVIQLIFIDEHDFEAEQLSLIRNIKNEGMMV